MLTVLKYLGRKEIDLVEETKNLGIDRYCEPFAGSFSNGMRFVERGFEGKVLLNDLDESVANYNLCMKEDAIRVYDNSVELVKQLGEFKWNDDIMHKIMEWKEDSDKFKRAASEYCYRTCQTMRGVKFNESKFHNGDIEFFLNETYLRDCEVTNLDYKVAMKYMDSESTFFLIDPPYLVDNVGKYYRCDSELFYHRGLKEYLDGIKGKWLLMYNDCEYIRELYKDYKIEEINCVMGSEIFIRNY